MPLAGPLALVLPGLPAGGYAPSTGATPSLEDLVRWRDLPYCIYPGPEDKCFSGAHLRRGGPGHRHVPRHRGGEHGRRLQRSAAAELGEGRGPRGGSHDGTRRLGPAVPRLRPLHLEEGGPLLLALGRHPARGPGGQAGARQLPAALARPGALGVPPPLRRGRPLHPGRRRRRLPLLLAHRRPPHVAVLQPHERRPVPSSATTTPSATSSSSPTAASSTSAPPCPAASTRRRPPPTARAG